MNDVCNAIVVDCVGLKYIAFIPEMWHEIRYISKFFIYILYTIVGKKSRKKINMRSCWYNM